MHSLIPSNFDDALLRVTVPAQPLPLPALPPRHMAIHQVDDDGTAWLRLSDDRTTFAVLMNADDLEALGHLVFAAAAHMRAPRLPANVISIRRERAAQ